MAKSNSNRTSNNCSNKSGKGNYGSKNFQKGQNRKNSTKRQRRNAEDLDGIEKSDFTSRTNDASWYARYPQLVKDAASISFGRPLGTPITSRNNASINFVATGTAATQNVAQTEKFAVPGIFVANFVPGIGYSDKSTSPINKSAFRFFTYMRSRLKTTGTYDANDMMLLTMAVDSMYMVLAWMRRIYGVAQLYSPINHYYPRQLLTALGVSPDKFTQGNTLMNLRSYINTYAIAVNQWCVPKNIEIFNRHEWMCEGLYTDGREGKAQTYLFDPEGFWKFSLSADGAGQLQFVKKPTTLFTSVDQIATFADQFINALLNDDDAGDISGDLLNAYGESVMRVAPQIPEGYTIYPAYDETVLMQIENATFVGTFSDVGPGSKITQLTAVGEGGLQWTPTVNVQQTTGLGQFVPGFVLGSEYSKVNFRIDNPDPLTIIEATRLTINNYAGSNTTTSPNEDVYLSDVGSDFCTTFRIHYYNADSGSFAVGHGSSGFVMTTKYDSTYLGRLASLLSSFDWHPAVHLYQFYNATNTVTYMGAIKDWANVGYVSYEEMAALNEVVMLSLFDIPLAQ